MVVPRLRGGSSTELEEVAGDTAGEAKENRRGVEVGEGGLWTGLPEGELGGEPPPATWKAEFGERSEINGSSILCGTTPEALPPAAEAVPVPVVTMKPFSAKVIPLIAGEERLILVWYVLMELGCCSSLLIWNADEIEGRAEELQAQRAGSAEQTHCQKRTKNGPDSSVLAKRTGYTATKKKKKKNVHRTNARICVHPCNQ